MPCSDFDFLLSEEKPSLKPDKVLTRINDVIALGFHADDTERIHIALIGLIKAIIAEGDYR